MESKTSFSSRGFTSMLLALCFTGLAFSGIVLYFAPPCSIAESMGWTVIGLSKVQWSAIHMTSAVLILFLAVIHLFVYNWKTMVCYFKKKNSTKSSIRLEMFLAIFIILALYLGSILMVPPISTLIDGNDAIKESYREMVQPGRGR